MEEGYRSKRFVCDDRYFENAMEYVKKEIPNCRFIFFSDDMEWVREKYRGRVEGIYESGKDNESVKLYMMSRCKHFILSNSTFSWWAWYLSDWNTEQKVISPRKWFHLDDFTHSLIDDSWIFM